MRKRALMMALAGSLSVGMMGGSALAKGAASEDLAELESEMESEEEGLGALIDSLLGEGSETVSTLTDAANEFLGEDGLIHELLGPESKLAKSFRLLVGSLQDAGSELAQSVNELADSLKEEGGEIGEIVSNITEDLVADGATVSESIGDMLSGMVGEDGAIDISGITSMISGFMGGDEGSADMVRDMYRFQLESAEDGPAPAALKQYILETNEDLTGDYEVRVPLAAMVDMQGVDEGLLALVDLWEIDGHIEENVFVAEGYVLTTEVVTLEMDPENESATLLSSEVVGEDGTLEELIEKYGFSADLYENESRADQPELAVVEAALRLAAEGEEIDTYRLGDEGEDVSMADGEEQLLDVLAGKYDLSISLDSETAEDAGIELSEGELAELEVLMADVDAEMLTEAAEE